MLKCLYSQKGTCITLIYKCIQAETAKKTKEWGFNFMAGEIDIFNDAGVERETEDESERETKR